MFHNHVSLGGSQREREILNEQEAIAVPSIWRGFF